jgi:gentisate 1,2-dioxygenase
MGTHATSPISPLFSYPWADTERSLHELARFSSDPFDDVAFDYTNPLTGGHVMPTIGCRIQMLRPGVHTQGDFLTIPPFAWHEHLNPSSDEAVLFSTTDAPVLEALCLYREDAYTKTGGHQEVKA